MFEKIKKWWSDRTLAKAEQIQNENMKLNQEKMIREDKERDKLADETLYKGYGSVKVIESVISNDNLISETTEEYVISNLDIQDIQYGDKSLKDYKPITRDEEKAFETDIVKFSPHSNVVTKSIYYEDILSNIETQTIEGNKKTLESKVIEGNYSRVESKIEYEVHNDRLEVFKIDDSGNSTSSVYDLGNDLIDLSKDIDTSKYQMISEKDVEIDSNLREYMATHPYSIEEENNKKLKIPSLTFEPVIENEQDYSVERTDGSYQGTIKTIEKYSSPNVLSKRTTRNIGSIVSFDIDGESSHIDELKIEKFYENGKLKSLEEKESTYDDNGFTGVELKKSEYNLLGELEYESRKRQDNSLFKENHYTNGVLEKGLSYSSYEGRTESIREGGILKTVNFKENINSTLIVTNLKNDVVTSVKNFDIRGKEIDFSKEIDLSKYTSFEPVIEKEEKYLEDRMEGYCEGTIKITEKYSSPNVLNERVTIDKGLSRYIGEETDKEVRETFYENGTLKRSETKEKDLIHTKPNDRHHNITINEYDVSGELTYKAFKIEDQYLSEEHYKDGSRYKSLSFSNSSRDTLENKDGTINVIHYVKKYDEDILIVTKSTDREVTFKKEYDIKGKTIDYSKDIDLSQLKVISKEKTKEKIKTKKSKERDQGMER